MENVKKFLLPTLTMMFMLCCTSLSYAQPSLSVCDTYTEVGSACSGTCGIGVIEYEVKPPCSSYLVNMCLQTEASSLCASHKALAKIYVNGILTATGNVTAAGSSLSFSAPCGAKVKAIVVPVLADKTIHCVWLGNVDFTLRRK